MRLLLIPLSLMSILITGFPLGAVHSTRWPQPFKEGYSDGRGPEKGSETGPSLRVVRQTQCQQAVRRDKKIKVKSSDRFFDGIFDRQLPVIEQTTEYTCGPAVLLSVLKRRQILTVPRSDQSLGSMIGTSSEVGTTPEQMVSGLRLFGLVATIHRNVNPTVFFETQIRGDRDYLFLVTDDGDAHWVALSSFTGQHIKLMDPYRNRGRIKVQTKNDFFSVWSFVQWQSNKIYRYLVIEVL